MMPICFHVVPGTGRQEEQGERVDLGIGEAVGPAVLVGDLRLDQHADEVVLGLLPAGGHDRRHASR